MIRIFWILRAILYKLLLKECGFLSYIGKPIFIYGSKNICIGSNVHIFPGLRIETHKGGSIILEDRVSIGQNFHITSCSETLVIGKDTTISGNVFVTNIDHEYQNIHEHILKQPYIIRHTEIGEGCFIGYGAAIQAGTVLGKHCVVGTNSVVRGTYPDYSVIVGVPAKVIKKYNMITNEWERV